MKEQTTGLRLVLFSVLALAACEPDSGGDGQAATEAEADSATSNTAGGASSAMAAEQQDAAQQANFIPGPPPWNPVGTPPGLLPAPDEASNPYADDSAALSEGRTLFVAYNCYGCHGGHGGGGMAPSLRDEVWLYGDSHADIYDSIAEGRPNAMPAWGLSLPPDVIWKITAYIKSMRTDQEPDPPMPREQEPQVAAN